MTDSTLKVEITFSVKVELTQDDMRQFDAIAGEICDRYKAAHPGRVMWPAGVGSKILYMPMTREEELPDSESVRDAYRVGRRVVVTVEPK